MCPTQDSAFTVLRLLSSPYRTAHVFREGAEKALCGQRRGNRLWKQAVPQPASYGTLAYGCGTCWPIYHERFDPQMRAIREEATS